MSLLTWIKNLFAPKTLTVHVDYIADEATKKVIKSKKRVATRKTNKTVKKEKTETLSMNVPVKDRNAKPLLLCERQALALLFKECTPTAKEVGALLKLTRPQYHHVRKMIGLNSSWANTMELHQYYDNEDCMMVFWVNHITHDPRETGRLFGISGNQVNKMMKELCEEDKREALVWVLPPSAKAGSDKQVFTDWLESLTEKDKERLKRYFTKTVASYITTATLLPLKTKCYTTLALRARQLLSHVFEEKK